MHSCVTGKNVKWCHLIWPTMYTRACPNLSHISGVLNCRVSFQFSLTKFTLDMCKHRAYSHWHETHTFDDDDIKSYSNINGRARRRHHTS